MVPVRPHRHIGRSFRFSLAIPTVSFISAGTLRRWSKPILLKLWIERGTRRTSRFRFGDSELRIDPTVFHPRYFGSSLIFARFVAALELRGKEFLDLGTGSGIVGLAAARAGAHVTSTDINPAAVRCAKENAAAAGFSIRCLESDVFDKLKADQFDVVAWNPPFFAKEPATIAEAAFYAGENHSVIRRFAREVREHLKPQGLIYLIFSLDGGLEALEQIFRDEGFAIKTVLSRRWGLAETMVVVEIQ
jgi:release factor glutamine methyltransferase